MFAEWLTKEKGFLLVTVNQELYYLKTFIRKAKDSGIDTLDEKWHSIKVPKSEKAKLKPIALTPAEVDLIYNHDFSASPKLYNAQTLLILGFYTGARISDLHKINTGNIITVTDASTKVPTTFEAFSYTQGKTGKTVVSPVHPRVKEYLKRDHHFLNRSTFGQYFKDIAKEAGLNRIVYGRTYGKETKTGYFELWELCSTHVMRRTFGSMYWGKIPTTSLMQILGHEKEEMTRRYIGVADSAGAKDLNKYWEKNG